MNHRFRETLEYLKQAGWTVEMRQDSAKLPPTCMERFRWLPDDVADFLCSCDSVISPSQKAWLNTWRELSSQSDSAFAWDQWELDSLTAAEGDDDWQADICEFWDAHFPLLLSVKSGYAFVAIRNDLAIVTGEEPGFEETVEIADNISDFFKMLCHKDGRLERLI